MKILLVSDLYIPAVNGVVTSVRTLKDQLRVMGHDARVLTLGETTCYDSSQQVYYASSYPVDRIYPGARVSLPNPNHKNLSVFSWEPDIIHTNSEFSAFYLAMMISKELKIPMVHTYHTKYEDYTRYLIKSDTLGKQLAKSYSKMVLDAIESIIVPTHKIKSLLEEYGVQKPMFVIPTGLHLEKFQRSLTPLEKKDLYDRHQLDPEKKLLLYIGRMGYEKNIQEIINYFKYLNRGDVQLVLGGDGPYLTELKLLSQKLGVEDRVKFLGMVPPDEVQNYYQIADVFVSASTSETQGLTYIEALASSTPVLCRRDLAIQHVVKNGENGYQYGDFREFKEGLSQIIDDEENHLKFKSQAWKTAIENFSAETFARDVLEKVYQPSLENFDFKKSRRNRLDLFP